MTTDTATRHVFAHLGPGPYRYLGTKENRFVIPGFGSKPGGSCDHCGTGILYEFHFRAADGREFKVGSSCVLKSGDAGLRRVIANDVKTQQAALRRARDLAIRIKALDAERAALAVLPTLRVVLAAVPHPSPFFASEGKTRADWFEFMLKNGYGSPKDRIARAADAVRIASQE